MQIVQEAPLSQWWQMESATLWNNKQTIYETEIPPSLSAYNQTNIRCVNYSGCVLFGLNASAHVTVLEGWVDVCIARRVCGPLYHDRHTFIWDFIHGPHTLYTVSQKKGPLWKKIENRLIFARVMDRNTEVPFFWDTV